METSAKTGNNVDALFLAVAKKRRVPVVMTLHDYHLVSPNYGMFDRLWIGVVDLVGVMWLARRRLRGQGTEEPRP